MISRNRPFQIAFWALMMAFGLSVIVAISDPHSVRRTILASANQTDRSFAADSVLVADVTEPAPTLAAEVAPQEIAETVTPQPRYVEPMPAVPQPYDEGPADFQAFSEGPRIVESHPVSSTNPQRETEVASDQRQPAGTMLVVSPEQLHGGSTRSKEVEFLPPPPDMKDEIEIHQWDGHAQTASLPLQTEPSVEADVSRRWLEAEILSLRQEVDRLTESQQIAERLDRLQQQQLQLISQHESLPVDRLLEVIDLLHQQLTSVREAFPPPPRDPQQRNLPESAEGSLTISESESSGSGRLSLQITEAELDDILNLLERISGTPVGIVPSQESSASSDVTSEELRLPVPTAARLTDVQSLSFQQEAFPEHRLPETRSSRCASCHQGQVSRR